MAQPPTSDMNLLFGILALQMDFISRDQLVAALHAWVIDKAASLGSILVAQKVLDADRHSLLEALVREHLKQHQNDPGRSLATLAADAVKNDLQAITDADLQGSLTHVSTTVAQDNSEGIVTEGVAAPSSARLRFRILRLHARGGLGQVFVAYDKELHREVALKEIQDRHADNHDSRNRFVLEAVITGGLEHPGIVPVYGLGQYADGRPYYAMRFIKGDSLKDAIASFHKDDSGESGLELRKLLARFIAVCEAIQYAHDRGVLHRDLKPGNIMLGKYGETLVVDWGLAKSLGKTEAASEEPTLRPQATNGNSETLPGAAIGTPAYMSPEQAAGRLRDMGPTSDVYSLGATLYCLLTGKPPIEDCGVAIALDKVQRGLFLRPRQVNPAVAPALEAVCLKAMQLKPENRYPSPRALAEDLEHWLADEPIGAWPEPWTVKTRRWIGQHRPLVSGAAAALAVGVIGLVIATVLLTAETQKVQIANDNLADERNKVKTAYVNLEQTNKDLMSARNKADEQRQQAEQARDAAAEALAVNTTMLAQSRWNDGQVSLAQDLLEQVPTRLRFGGWHLLKRQFEGSYCTLFGHLDGVTCVTFSPDRERLASGSQDRTIKIWDARNGKDLFTLKGHVGELRSVCFSPDGKQLASASSDRTIKVWNTRTGEHLFTLKGHTGEIRCVTFSPDGHRLASAGGVFDNTVKVWNLKKSADPLTLKGHRGWVASVSFSPAGDQIASASGDQTVKVWDANNGDELLTLKGHTGDVRSVCFSPDGQRLATGSSDRTVKVWQLKKDGPPLTFKGHTDWVENVCFSPEGQRVASASRDRTAVLWDIKTGQDILVLRGHGESVTSAAFSADGQRLATGSWDATVKVWDARSEQDILTLNGHTDSVTGMAFSPDGQRIASASLDSTIKVWDVRRGLAILTLEGHTDAATGLTYRPDGNRLASASWDKTIKVWDLRTEQAILTLTGHTGYVESVAYSPDGNRLASASYDTTIKLWNARKKEEPLTLKGHTDAVTSITFSRDGEWLVSGSRDGLVKIWDSRDGKEIRTLKGHTADIMSVDLSSNGQTVASASKDRTVKLWNVSTGQCQFTLKGHVNTVTSVAFRPDGQTVASGSADGAVKVWDTHTGQDLLTFKEHKGDVQSVAFSRDGERLISGGKDKSVKMWDVRASQELLTFRGHLGDVRSVSFSNDGQRLASTSDDRTARIWDTRTGQLLFTLVGHGEGVASTAFSPDGQRLASASQDRTVKVWNAQNGQELLTLKGHADRVLSVRFSDDGKRIISRDDNGAILVWDAVDGRKLPAGMDAVPLFAPNARNSEETKLAVPVSERIYLRDLKPPTPGEAIFLEDMFRVKPWWHREQALRHEKEKSVAAAAFHWSWVVYADPTAQENWKRLDDACRQLKNWRHSQEVCTRLAREKLDHELQWQGEDGTRWMDFLFAIAHHRLGNEDRAKRYFERATLPATANPEQRQTFESLRREAAQQMGLPGKE